MVGGSVVLEQGDVRDHGGIDGSGDYEGETFATVTTLATTSDSATSGAQATAMAMEDGDGVEVFGRGSEGVVTTTANKDCERADWNSDFLLAMYPSRDGSTRAAAPSPAALGDGAIQFDTRASAQENVFSSRGQQQYSVRIPWAPNGSVSGFGSNTFEAIGADGFKASLPTDRAAPISTSRNGQKPRSADGQPNSSVQQQYTVSIPDDEDLLCSSSGEEGPTIVDTTGFTVVLSSPSAPARRRANAREQTERAARTSETTFGHGHDFLPTWDQSRPLAFLQR